MTNLTENAKLQKASWKLATREKRGNFILKIIFVIILEMCLSSASFALSLDLDRAQFPNKSQNLQNSTAFYLVTPREFTELKKHFWVKKAGDEFEASKGQKYESERETGELYDHRRRRSTISGHLFGSPSSLCANITIVSQTSALIQGGHQASALLEFNGIGDDRNDRNEMLAQIVKSAYSGNLENVDKIVSFVRILPLTTQDAIAYPALYDDMARRGHLTSPEILLLAHNVDETLSNWGSIMSSSTKSILTNLKRQVDRNVATLMSGWTTKVRSRDFGQLVDFSKTSHHARQAFITVLPTLIKSAYGNSRANFPPVYGFARNTHYVISYATATETLLSEMTRNGHADGSEILEMGYRIKEAIEGNNDEDTSRMWARMKSKLPSWVRNLVWVGVCTVKNNYHGEYLYAASDGFAHGPEQRSVFLWIPGETVRQGIWEFVTMDYGATYLIRNTVHNEYLYVSTSEYDGQRRKVFTWRHKGQRIGQDVWRLEPVDGEFRLKNINCNTYLYGAGDYSNYDEDRRRVFGWKGSSSILEGYWNIDC